MCAVSWSENQTRASHHLHKSPIHSKATKVAKETTLIAGTDTRFLHFSCDAVQNLQPVFWMVVMALLCICKGALGGC